MCENPNPNAAERIVSGMMFFFQIYFKLPGIFVPSMCMPTDFIVLLKGTFVLS